MDRPFIHKNVVGTFNSLHEFNSKKKLKIKEPNSPLNNQQIEVWKNGNNFEFSIDRSEFEISTNYTSLFDTCSLIGENKNYRFYKDSLQYCSISLGDEKTTGRLTSFIEAIPNITKKQYFRVVQKIMDSPKVAYIEGAIDLKTDQEDLLLYGVGYNHLIIENLKVETFRIDFEREEFIFIDSCSKVEFEKFKSIVDSYFVAYGFVFGETVGNEVYYLSSESDTFKEFTQTIFLTKSENPFIESNPIFNSRIPSQKKIINFPKLVFENICNNYLNIEAYSRSINIVNEGLKAPSPLAKGVLFSSGLETISTAILSSKKPPKPINNENLKKGNLLKKLKNIIKEDNYLTESEKEFLIEKKINSLNNPTFIDKTIEAFNSNNIDLPASLIKVIKYRNKYLHGSIPDEKEFGFLIDNLTRAFEMQFLVSILILKYSGYSGYVQNKSAILEYHAHMKNNSFENIELKQAIYYKI